MSARVQFATLLAPFDDDSEMRGDWLGLVICSNGAAQAIGPARHDTVAGRANEVLTEMVQGLSGPVGVWFVQTTWQTAQELEALRPADLFRLLARKGRRLAGVDVLHHEVIDLT